MAWKLALVVAALAVLLPAVGYPVGLGSIAVRSVLDQPLRAEIEVFSEDPNELSKLNVHLASASDFQHAGLERPAVLSQLRFEMVRRANGRTVITIRSVEPMREPLLNVLLEIAGSSGRLLREYPILLDPPRSSSRSAQDQSTEEGVRFQASAPPNAVPRPLPDHYGPIRRDETLWRVAGALRPDDSLSNQQIMVALIQANPEYFEDGRVNRLKAGTVLRVPTIEQMHALTRREAIAELRDRYQLWRDKKHNPPSPPTKQPPPQPTPQKVAPEPGVSSRHGEGHNGEGNEKHPSSNQAAPQKGAGQGGNDTGSVTTLRQQIDALQGTAHANQRESDALQAQIAALEAQLTEMRRMLLAKDENLATPQASLGGARAPTIPATSPPIAVTAPPLVGGGHPPNGQPQAVVLPSPTVASSGAVAHPPASAPAVTTTTPHPVVLSAPAPQPASPTSVLPAQPHPLTVPPSLPLPSHPVNTAATAPSPHITGSGSTRSPLDWLLADPVLAGLVTLLLGMITVLGVLLIRRRMASTSAPLEPLSGGSIAERVEASPSQREATVATAPALSTVPSPEANQPAPHNGRAVQSLPAAAFPGAGRTLPPQAAPSISTGTVAFTVQERSVPSFPPPDTSTVATWSTPHKNEAAPVADAHMNETDQTMVFDLGFLENLDDTDDMEAPQPASRPFPPVAGAMASVVPVPAAPFALHSAPSGELDMDASWEALSTHAPLPEPSDSASHVITLSAPIPVEVEASQTAIDLNDSLDLDWMEAGESQEAPSLMQASGSMAAQYSVSPSIAPTPISDFSLTEPLSNQDNAIAFDLVGMDESFDLSIDEQQPPILQETPEHRVDDRKSGAEDEIENTLALAQSYLDWGDQESARELLREVVNEGNATQRQAAQALLIKFG